MVDGADDGVGLRPPAQDGHNDGGLTEVVRVEGEDDWKGEISEISLSFLNLQASQFCSDTHH